MLFDNTGDSKPITIEVDDEILNDGQIDENFTGNEGGEENAHLSLGFGETPEEIEVDLDEEEDNSSDEDSNDDNSSNDGSDNEDESDSSKNDNGNATEADEDEDSTEEVDGTITYLKDNDLLAVEIPEDFEDTEENRIELLKQSNDAIRNNFAAALNQQTGGLVAHLLNGGTTENFKDSKIGYTDLDESKIEEDITKQRDIVRAYYSKTTNFSEKKITGLIQRAEEDEELESEWKEALTELKDITNKENIEVKKQLKQNKENADKQAKEILSQKLSNVDKTEKYIINLTPKLKNDVKSNITEGKTMSKINKNFAKYHEKLVMLDELGLLDGDTSKIEKVLKSNATKKAKKSFNGSSKSRKSNRDVNQDLNRVPRMRGIARTDY